MLINGSYCVNPLFNRVVLGFKNLTILSKWVMSGLILNDGELNGSCQPVLTALLKTMLQKKWKGSDYFGLNTSENYWTSNFNKCV
jgi:hypothetical protein